MTDSVDEDESACNVDDESAYDVDEDYCDYCVTFS
jgi:hypothetical protein